MAADIARVDHLRHEFEARAMGKESQLKKVADIFEAIVLMQSELNEWLGNARTLKVAPYDDNQPPRRKRTGYGVSAWANARA